MMLNLTNVSIIVAGANCYANTSTSVKTAFTCLPMARSVKQMVTS